MDAKQVWRAALGELQVSLSPANYETWLRETNLVEVDDNRFRIAVPNGFAKEWLETRYRSLIAGTLGLTSVAVRLQAAGLSLLTARVTVYDAAGRVVATTAATDPTNNENDTMFLVYRVTVVPEPGVMASLGAGAIGLAMAVSRLRRAGGRDH